MLHWILQNNYSEEGFEALTTALDRVGSSYSIHKCIPFTGEITDPEVLQAKSEGTKFITMGSYSLANYAVKQGYLPGAFLDNLDYELHGLRWGVAMLNFDSFKCRFDSVPGPLREPFFIRPIADTKSMVGQVMDWPTYEEWRDKLRSLPPEELIPGKEQLHELRPWTRVLVAEKQEIYSETRVWIVNRKVVTSSGYKVGTIKRYSEPHSTDERILKYAQAKADHWSPNDAYVMDVFDTPRGLRIGEINNINSAGFYKADMCKLVGAIEELLA